VANHEDLQSMIALGLMSHLQHHHHQTN